MKIYKISPQGFCNGVKYAINILNKTIDDLNTPRPIYLLGNLIHNKVLMDEFKEKGVIVIKGGKRYDMLDEAKSGTVIFSAHGVSPRVYDKALKKGLNIVDATCPNVLIIHNQIIKYLQNDFEIIYIGTKNHPECEGVIEISDKIHLITSLDEINSLSLNNKNIYITNQTTLSIYDIEDIYLKLKEKYPFAVVENKICQATTLRQKALLNQNDAQICIVVGDKTSSNSKKLKTVSEEKALIKSYLVETEDDLDKNWFKNISSVSVTSGASTPSEITDRVIQRIKEIAD